VWAVVFAVLTILPALSKPGLWEPQEMKVADNAAARVDAPARDDDEDEDAPKDPCRKTGTPTGSRTLGEQLAAQGLDHLGSDEGDLRLGGALLGILCVLAAFGTGARLAGPRAGLIGAIVLLSFPLLVLQARQLTSEIGTAAGATLLVYALVALARPAGRARVISDVIVALEVAALCVAIAFLGGGMFLGVVPPLGGVALAGGLGLVLFGATARLARQLYYRALGVVSPRRAVGRLEPLPAAAGLTARDAWTAAIALLAFVGTLAAAYVLIDQIYDVQARAPGTREVMGKSFVPTECWSSALGGVWRNHDDGRSAYDSMFEQAGFGMFPWSVLVPVALLGLALSTDEKRRYAGRLTLGWAILAWVTGTVFQRKVGFTIYAGFPACAIAIGVWIDAFLDRRPQLREERSALGLLVGLWVLLGMVTIAKDLQAFPDRLTSLLVGGEAIKYPKIYLLEVPLRAWLLVLAGLTGLSFALGAWLWRPADQEIRGPGPVPWWGWIVLGVAEVIVIILAVMKSRWELLHFPVLLAALALPALVLFTRGFALRFFGRWGVHLSLVMSLLTGIFWAQGWQPTLSRALSSKHVFSVYRALRQDGDKLAILGDMGNAPRYYAGGEPEALSSKEQLIDYLGVEDHRVFALAPKSDHCPIHRAFSGRKYFVLDDTNAKFMLLSNRVDGGKDHNPLTRLIVREQPEGIKVLLDPTKKLPTWDNKLQLIGYTMPRAVSARSKFEMTLYFKVLEPVSGAWKIFLHFDGRGQRFQGDHDPIDGRCATSFWQKGDYIVDTFTVEAGDITFAAGDYAAKLGFFTGTSPNWKNMKVSAAPDGAADDADRVTIGSIRLE